MDHRFVRSVENIAIVSKSVAEYPNVSILCRSQELGVSNGTLWYILHLDLHLHPYKVQLKQQLKPADHSQHREYVEWLLEQQALDGNFSNSTIERLPPSIRSVMII